MQFSIKLYKMGKNKVKGSLTQREEFRLNKKYKLK